MKIEYLDGNKKKPSKKITIPSIILFIIGIIIIDSIEFKVILGLFLLFTLLSFIKKLSKFCDYTLLTISFILIFTVLVFSPNPIYSFKSTFYDNEATWNDINNPHLDYLVEGIKLWELTEYEIRDYIEIKFKHMTDIEMTGNLQYTSSLREAFLWGVMDCEEISLLTNLLILRLTEEGYFKDVKVEIVYQPLHSYNKINDVDISRFEELDELEKYKKLPFAFLGIVIMELPISRQLWLFYGYLLIIFRFLFYKK